MTIAITVGIAALVFLIFFFAGYLKAPPDTAYIISGLGKRRILIGRAGWRFPFITRVDKLTLRVMQVDVKTESFGAYSDFESKNINFNGFGREISSSGSNQKSLF